MEPSPPVNSNTDYFYSSNNNSYFHCLMTGTPPLSTQLMTSNTILCVTASRFAEWGDLILEDVLIITMKQKKYHLSSTPHWQEDSIDTHNVWVLSSKICYWKMSEYFCRIFNIITTYIYTYCKCSNVETKFFNGWVNMCKQHAQWNPL